MHACRVAVCDAAGVCLCQATLRSHVNAQLPMLPRRARAHLRSQLTRPWAVRTSHPHQQHPARASHHTQGPTGGRPPQRSARTMPVTLAANRSCFFVSSPDATTDANPVISCDPRMRQSRATLRAPSHHRARGRHELVNTRSKRKRRRAHARQQRDIMCATCKVTQRHK